MSTARVLETIDMTTISMNALYDTRAAAEQAAERLEREVSVARANITISAQEAGTVTEASTAGGTAKNKGFFQSMKNLFMPDDDQHAYSEAIRRGGFLLTAQVAEDDTERAAAILEEHGAVDLDDRQETWRTEGSTGDQTTMAAQQLPDGSVIATAATAPSAAPSAATTAAAAVVGNGEEDKIALVEEQLRVGKRSVEGGRVRVRSYVVETPVQEQVTLREENVSLERHAVDRPVTDAEVASFGDRTIEVTATSEEAVVGKTAQVTEEIVLHKSVEDRVETVHDTVRHTEVQVDDDRASRAAGDAARPVTMPTSRDPAPRR
jgi:uncharacterized protein (TIGR02271 family)